MRGGYAIEALQWLLDDGVAARIEVVSRRSGQDAAALDNDIYQRDGSVWNMRFDDYWRELNYG
ncbi:phage GP46 family protein [Lelliottia amnigena]|uniref:Phage GP46 family protein n=1 Tax=Lelliottia amnigena TaxID=61646 RepID=A0AAP2ABR1_LELAM|nr:phage GP46 family protein [Lelliottia amnigena]MBL5933642.1 phage GP46 family protein [Lelliottia amnigena]